MIDGDLLQQLAILLAAPQRALSDQDGEVKRLIEQLTSETEQARWETEKSDAAESARRKAKDEAAHLRAETVRHQATREHVYPKIPMAASQRHHWVLKVIMANNYDDNDLGT